MAGSLVTGLTLLVLVGLTSLDFGNAKLLLLFTPPTQPAHIQLCDVPTVAPRVVGLRSEAPIMGHVPFRSEYLMTEG